MEGKGSNFFWYRGSTIWLTREKNNPKKGVFNRSCSFSLPLSSFSPFFFWRVRGRCASPLFFFLFIPPPAPSQSQYEDVPKPTRSTVTCNRAAKPDIIEG